MKQQISRYLISTGTAILLSTTFEQTVRAEGEKCEIGGIGLSASPSTLNINISEKNGCKYGGRMVGTLVLRTTGSEPILMYGVEVTPYTPEDNFFMSIDTVKHMSVQMETSDTWQFAFTPKKAGDYKATVTYTYGYGNHTLSNYKYCLKKQYDAELAAKNKLVREMEVVGPDYRMINARVEREKKDHEDKVRQVKNRIMDLKERIRELEQERETVLQEMMDGEYCSECKRGARQIEKEDKVSFEEHIRLGASNGRHVRYPSPEERDQKALEYEAKIKPFRDQIPQEQAKIPGIDDRHAENLKLIELQRKILKEAFDKRLNALRAKRDETQQQYNAAMSRYYELEKVRKTITSQLGGTCYAK